MDNEPEGPHSMSTKAKPRARLNAAQRQAIKRADEMRLHRFICQLGKRINRGLGITADVMPAAAQRGERR